MRQRGVLRGNATSGGIVIALAVVLGRKSRVPADTGVRTDPAVELRELEEAFVRSRTVGEGAFGDGFDPVEQATKGMRQRGMAHPLATQEDQLLQHWRN